MKIAIIPARGNSKRIKRKNIKKFYNKPIIQWTIEKLKKSKLFDLIIVSSEDNEILKISKKSKCDLVIKRPKKLSGDNVTTIAVIKHAIKKINMSISLNFKKIKGNLVHSTSVINWKKIKIGKGNIIGPYVVIGNNPQWKNKKPSGKKPAPAKKDDKKEEKKK